MRKTNLFGATFLVLTASAWSLTAVAQTAAPAPAAPMATPAAPMAAPAAPMATPDAAPAPAPADTATTSAPMPMKKPMMHHKMMMHGKGKLAATPAGNKAVEDLNAASLDAAKTGKPFVAPTTPPAAKMTAHSGMHKHHMMKPKGDATAPTAPADTAK